MNARITASLLVLAACASPSRSPTVAHELWLPSTFGDRMVLQRERIVPVWGRVSPGSRVEVAGSWGERARGTSDATGTFRIGLRTPSAGGPFEVTVRANGATKTLTDVLVGEVWLCSGQSNMEWRLRASQGGELAAQAAADGDLRLFTVPNRASVSPQIDCDAEWVSGSPMTAPDFSAVGYHFGRILRAQLGVPVGLIQSDWGGTPAESWTSATGLRPLGDFDAKLDAIAMLADDPGAAEAEYERAVAAWRDAFASAEPGTPSAGALGWCEPDIDTSDWRDATLPGNWEQTELGQIDGTVWYRRRVDIPTEWQGHDLRVELGPVDDRDVTWLGGEEIGRIDDWQAPRRYAVDAMAFTAGPTVLAVRVHDTGGAGGFHGSAEQMKLTCVETGESVSLAGQWQVKRGARNRDLPAPPRRPGSHPHTPSGLFNGMIAPIVPFAIRGAIWYQGESNRTRAAQYRELFPAMIHDWREHWGQGDFPFYFVQIAPFAYGGDTGEAAELKEAQLLTMRTVTNTGMVVTTDVGNPQDIHPADKQTVGERLAAWALAKTYGADDAAYCGPIYDGMQIEGAKIRVSFEHSETGLNGGQEGGVSCFSIAGADQQFHPARATIEGQTVVVWADAVPDPVAVRFGWGAADEPDLKNGAGFPASPFRTDDWPLVTAK